MNIVLNMEHTYKTLDDRVETIEQVKKKTFEADKIMINNRMKSRLISLKCWFFWILKRRLRGMCEDGNLNLQVNVETSLVPPPPHFYQIHVLLNLNKYRKLNRKLLFVDFFP